MNSQKIRKARASSKLRDFGPSRNRLTSGTGGFLPQPLPFPGGISSGACGTGVFSTSMIADIPCPSVTLFPRPAVAAPQPYVEPNALWGRLFASVQVDTNFSAEKVKGRGDD